MSINKEYVMGLDLGTSSIGAAAIGLDQQAEPESILDHHVYLFKEPVNNEKGTLVSKKASRRLARQARKQRDRRNGRLRALSGLLKTKLTGDLCISERKPDTANDIKRFEAMALRAHAVTEAVSFTELHAIILHLSKARGYSSGFKALSKNKQEQLKTELDLDKRAKIIGGDVQPGHDRLAHIMKLRSCQTVGQYLLDRAKRGLPSILKSAERPLTSKPQNAIDAEINIETKKEGTHFSYQNLYALRSELVAEFDLIWSTQVAFHPSLTKELGQTIKETLFYQRPLKSIAPMMGGCMLEPNLPRAHKSHPAFQAFRIEKTLADLRWGYGRRSTELSTEEKRILREALNNPNNLDAHSELSFEKIYQLLPEPPDTEFRLGEPPRARNLNLANGGRDSLPGNKTNQRWRQLGMGDAWLALSPSQQTWVINFLADLGSVESLLADDWQSQFGRLPNLKAKSHHLVRENAQLKMMRDKGFVDFINEFRLNPKCDRLTALKFDNGRASYSIKALKNINEWFAKGTRLPGTKADEHQAIQSLYQTQTKTNKVLDYLDNPAKTGNGVVDIALMQVKKVVNHFIERHGKPRHIVVELTREMGEGLTRRNEVQSQQNQHHKSHKEATHDMSNLGIAYSKTNVLRHRLAQDQQYTCPYCAKHFESTDIYNGAETEIEHIVPQSITQVGRKYSEIVLAHQACNQRKGKRVPLEAFSFNIGPIQDMAKKLREKKQDRKANLLLMAETPDTKLDDVLLQEFSERQFHETAWISKLTATWLKSLGIPVYCVKGKMTEQLRRQWGLMSIIPEARITEGLPVYSTLNKDGEVKETIIPKDAMFDEHGEPTLLWNYWADDKLSKDQFAELHQTGLYPYDKRCDHRHHLIDAITIALCDPSMIQRMAREYKRRSEAEAQKIPEMQRTIRFGRVACPMPNIKKQAKEAVTEQRVTHRPDRFVSGAWFQETAYGLYTDKNENSKQYLINRVNVRSLIGKDHATTRKNILDCIGQQVRDSLMASYQLFCQAIWGEFEPPSSLKTELYKTAVESLWGEPPTFGETERPMHKVMQKKTAYLSSKHVRIEHPNRKNKAKPHHKVLIADENACIAWDSSNPNLGFQCINNFEARLKKDKNKSKKYVFKGDTILAKNMYFVVTGLSPSPDNNRIETMRLVCTKVKRVQAEGRQDFSLSPSKVKGSMSLWDITAIIQDPFDGRSARTAD